MKQPLAIVLAITCVVLVVVLIVLKRGDDAQHESDATAITDFSNRLDLAEMHLSIGNGTALIFSNNLNESQSALLTISNQLAQAESTLALEGEQVTNLSRQVADGKSEKQTLSQQLANLNSEMTNQAASLTKQLAAIQATLKETNQNYVQLGKDYGLLENKLRINVAERLVTERKFNNLPELKTQMSNIKTSHPGPISAESIYAGLNVKVDSNGTFHVIAPE